MNLLAIVAALALEEWRSFQWRARVERAFVLYARGIERRLNGGTLGQGIVATILATVPPVLLTGLVWVLLARLHPALGLLFNVLALYALMGFRRFSHAISAIIAALKTGDLVEARRALAGWNGVPTNGLSSQDVARLAI